MKSSGKKLLATMGWRLSTSYKKGKVHSIERWKPNGEKCPHSHVMNGNGVLVFYNRDGTEMKRVSYKGGELFEPDRE